METFTLLLKIVHILAGTCALLTGALAIILRKKVKLHKPVGRIYLYSMAVIFISSIYLSVYRQNVFLFFIAVFTFHSTFTAYRSLKLKKLHNGQKPARIDWIIETLNIVACGGLVILGLILFTKNNVQFGIICTVFGVLGIRFSLANIKRLRGKFEGTAYWLMTHAGGMLGSYIGVLTAFAVNNNRMMSLPPVVAWLAPTLILLPFMFYELARIKKSIPQVKTATA